jgi:hypothetical protein
LCERVKGQGVELPLVQENKEREREREGGGGMGGVGR